MQEINHHVLGVMSGTSLDGIDLVHIKFTQLDVISYQIFEHETIPYSKEWLEILKEAINYSEDELYQCNQKYTIYLSELIKDFISKHNLHATIDYVSSHGHTIKHQPQNGITLQIGNLPEIATLLSKTVVCDFRVQDVLLSGQGAPLVPIGDEILFQEYDYCLNLGGFSNISTSINQQRIAFDITPANIVLNHYCRKLNLEYDNQGKIARAGKLNQSLLNELNSIEFYAQKPPKSLGLEFVQEKIFPIISKYSIDIQDILHTFVHHIAIQISQSIKPKKTMLITGGGVYNLFLIDCIKKYSKDIKIVIPDSKTIEFKEALIFGLLGFLKINGAINVLKSYTGASENHSSGKIFYI